MPFCRSVIVCLVLAAPLCGCLPEPRLKDNSQLINGGVNIVPAPVLAAEKQRPSTARSDPDAVDLLTLIESSDEKATQFVKLLRASGVDRTLLDAGPFTVLAPNDAAFDKLPPGTVDELLKPANKDRLVSFVRYHILRGRVTFGDLINTNGQVQTLDGPPASPSVGANSAARPMGTAVIVKGTDGKVVINDANVLRSDTNAHNGIVHWIDHVLLPPAPLDNRSVDTDTGQ